MNLVILGMQGAGKTVFISQFYYYMREKYGKDAIVSRDLASGRYIAEIRDTLEGTASGCPGWPESTKQGDLKMLHFKLNAMGVEGNCDLIDVAGQDIEEYLGANENDEKTEVQEKIQQMLDNADMLMFLFDLLSFAQKTGHKQQAEDNWIFSRFVEICKTRKIPGLIILSKADNFPQLSPESYEDSTVILQFIQKTLQTNINWSLPPPDEDLFTYCAVSSLKTKTCIIDGEPKQLPKLPLTSQGFDAVF